MYKALNGAIVALGLAGAALAMSGPASADGIGIHVGGIGIGASTSVMSHSDIRTATGTAVISGISGATIRRCATTETRMATSTTTTGMIVTRIRAGASKPR